MVDLTYLKSNVFPGESGGDYNALFGYANRQGRPFQDVRLTDMTINQVLDFTDPSGPYAQSVKGQIGRVATPTGAYQVVGSTLRDAMRGLGLTGNELYNEATQDKIGQWIYQNQGPSAWQAWGGSNGGSTVRGSSRNFSGGPDLEPEQTGLLGFITDPEKRARLALALSGMALNPNQAVQALAQDKLATAETGRINNRTAQWLSQRGRDDLAEAVMRGIVPAKEAVTQAMQPTDELRNLQIETARVNLDRLKSGADADPNVQSSAPLPDQSGVVLTMRNGTVQVRTVGGEVLDGQAALDFVRTAQENSVNYQRDINEARATGTLTAQADLGAAAAGAAKQGELMANAAFEAYKQAQMATSAISTMDDAIAAIDRGARSGLVENFLPNVTEASAALNNAMNIMGLDVIASVTFGALSEAEMNLAMETAAPRNLEPAALREWLVNKRNAQEKARDALMNAANYFSVPSNTLQGWLARQGQSPASNNVIQYDAQGNRIQ
jgi:hypothetical protein